MLTVEGDLITADMGSPKVLGDTAVGVRDGRPAASGRGRPATSTWATRTRWRSSTTWPTPGRCWSRRRTTPAIYPNGVNVEFVVRRGERHVAMRVHERGSGETRSCGTGACAVMVAAALADGVAGPPAEDTAYRVDVPGGTLTVTWTADDRVLLTGPAVVVARGTTDL